MAALLAAPTPALALPCDGSACNFATLAPFLAKLRASQPMPGKPAVHIVQIGDSHTAGDVLTGAWRDLLQARYGNGGRGVLAPGRPWDGYITRGVTATMSPGWSVAATFGKGAGEPRPPLGLASYSLTATAPGATIGLSADTPAMTFDRVVLCALAGPTAPTLTVRIGAIVQRIALIAPIVAPRCTSMTSAVPQMAVQVAADAPGATITSWATFRDNGGVALSNLGVVGAQLDHFGRTDDMVLREELRTYTPDLIVVAFGTNEGFAPRFDPRAYDAILRRQIERVRTAAPGVPILMLGAPDALSRNPALRTNADGDALACPDAGTPALFAPPALAGVRTIQRRVAQELGLAFWDWQAAMGGACAAQRWTDAVPPLMRPDHVHFLRAGGQSLAQRLQADLDRAMTE
jgi:lysophospholipase L1-like esterase